MSHRLTETGIPMTTAVTRPVALLTSPKPGYLAVVGHLYVATPREDAGQLVALCVNGHGVYLSLADAEYLVSRTFGQVVYAPLPAWDAATDSDEAALNVESDGEIADALRLTLYPADVDPVDVVVWRKHLHDALAAAVDQVALTA